MPMPAGQLATFLEDFGDIVGFFHAAREGNDA